MDLQHDGVVYMVENFCCRASPTRSREREIWRAAVWWIGLKEWGWRDAPLPSIYRELAGPRGPSSKP